MNGSPPADDRSGSAPLEAGGPTLASSKRASIVAPPPERTPQPMASGMLDRWGLLGRFLSRLFFAAVFFPVEAVETVRRAAGKGTVVYVLRMRNTLEFLYFNYAFLAHGLPLARFANGVRLLLWQPLGQLLRRLFGRAAPRREGVEVLRRLTRAHRSSALFLRNPLGLIPPAEFEGPYLATLVALQRELDRPVILVPVTVIWGRQPVRASPGFGPLLHVLDPLLGDQDEPRLFRRVWQVLRHARRSLALVCEPLNLQEFLADRSAAAGRGGAAAVDGDPAQPVRALEDELLARIEAERRVRIGPRRSHPVEIRRRILDTTEVKATISRGAAAAGVPASRVRRQAQRVLRRMQAAMTSRGLSRLSWIVRHFWKRMYSGFEVDEAGLARVKEIGKQGPLIFLPTHRSHVDYLVLSDLCLARDLQPPHIAAGVNLSFWPLGWLFRTSGAFFIRRSFQGDELYTTLLNAYVTALLREGHNIEIFIEGGRTRTGQVLPPKTGLLSVIADVTARGEVPPVHVVPVSIGYERVIELPSLTRELTGGAKHPESFAGVLKAGRALRSNYGWVNVQLGAPIALREFLAARGHTGPATAPETRRQAIRSLGYHNNAAAGAVTAITPTALCAAALLVPTTRGVHRSTLVGIVERLGTAARDGGARFVESMWREGRALSADGLDYALELLTRDGAVSTMGRGADAVYVAEKEARLRLDYYKNQIVQHLLEPALMALVLRTLRVEEGEAVAPESLDRASRFIASLVRLHFVHGAGATVEALIAVARQRLLALGALREDAPTGAVRIVPEGQRLLADLAPLLESVIEAHGAAARALLVLRAGPMLRRSLEQETLEQLHRWYLTGELRRYESCQIAFVRTALEWLCDEGILVQQGAGPQLEVGLARAHGDGQALEVLVQRIERLLPARAA